IVTGEPISITTGGRPPTLPEVAIEGESLSSGGFVVTSMVASPSAAVILDGDGDYVWWHVFDDPEYLISSVELSTDRRWMLVLLERPGGFCHGFARVRLDGAVEEIQLLDDAHHDFAELGEGATALLRWDNRTIDADIVRGDRISELGADGSLTDVWSLWDQREPDPALIGGELGDWGHSNHLVLGGDGESYYVSIRNLSAILKIDRATGGIAWQLGGDEGSLAFPDGEKPFIHQHGFDLTESGLVLFDNGDELAGTSRVVEIAIDEEHGTAEVVWTHAAEPPQFCYALGDVQRLPAGNTLVAWSVLGRIEEVTPDHEMLWRADLSMGGGVGYVTWLESLYPAVDAGSGD
ncbi:MAG: aryl-sulfate sulfotransferase, partial [Myxococcota bacterium]|nr:aryl-sulfate sulfotransferase [Myxococcota bacterium]